MKMLKGKFIAQSHFYKKENFLYGINDSLENIDLSSRLINFSLNGMIKFAISKLLIITGLLLFTSAKVTIAQEMHFSQFYAAPMTINPALCGFFDGKYRVGLNYKEQWNGFTNGYQTQAAYLDLKISDIKNRQENWFGAGVNVLNDVAGDGSLSNLKCMFFVSYQKAMNIQKSVYFSVGYSAGFIQQSLDISKLYFGSQWVDGEGFVTTNPSNENFYRTNYLFFDMNAGANLAFRIRETHLVYGGISLNHITQPTESFYKPPVNEFRSKYILHLNAIYKVNDIMRFEPAIYYTMQSAAYESLIGANLTYKKFYYGLWMRLSGSFSPVIGYSTRNFRSFISYDIDGSKLTPASNGQGGFELSMAYVFFSNNKPKVKDPKVKYDCPFF